MLKVSAVFHEGSFFISLLVLGYYDQSRLTDWLFCPPLGQIVIFIYQLITMLPALIPPSRETLVKWMKTDNSIPQRLHLKYLQLLTCWMIRGRHKRLGIFRP